MSKYDALNAHTELEPTIAEDLRGALEKRGLKVTQNAPAGGYAPAGQPDIVAENRSVVITFEATKSRGAAQDRELNSIRDHLNRIKEDNPTKKCFCVFLSSDTSNRMLDGIRDHNQQRESEDKADLRILPLSFDSLELWATRAREAVADLYPVSAFLELFKRHAYYIDDLRIKKLLLQEVFPNDAELAAAVEKEETERDQRTLESLIKDLARMENYLRENGIAVGHAAIDTLIYLVFLKLYEEKREQSGKTNRLRSTETFEKYRQDSVDAPTQRRGRAVHALFGAIKNEREFKRSKMFTEGDNLADSVTDEFMLNYAIPALSKYKFIGTRIDALGAVYEVLALRAEKDVKVGQFFTPENVVLFMARMAQLDYKDMVLDPACGTGRFLIYAMDAMVKEVDRSQARDKDNGVRSQNAVKQL